MLLEEDAVVSRDELKDVAFLYDNYERCQDHITHAVVKATATGRIFYGLWSNEDTCDGGNAVGALFRLQEKVADVGDSEVACKTRGFSYETYLSHAKSFAENCVDPSAVGDAIDKTRDASATDETVRSWAKDDLRNAIPGEVELTNADASLEDVSIAERYTGECRYWQASLEENFSVLGYYGSNEADEGGWGYFLRADDLDGQKRLLKIQAYHHN